MMSISEGVTIKLSIAIITFNEEANIRRCIQSVAKVADEVVVVDSYSTDGTEGICRELGVRFFKAAFAGHIEQKNFALEQTRFEHVLSLDADEELSPALIASIQTLKQHCVHDGYTFNRLNNYAGQWIRHCGWYPDIHWRHR